MTVEPALKGTLTLECHHPVPCRSLTECSYKHPRFDEDTMGEVFVWEKPQPYRSYVLGGDVAEGVDGDYSVARVKDAKTLKTVAKFKSKLCPPDLFAVQVFALGAWYNNAYTGVESNKDGLWVNSELFKMGYPNLYFREQLDDITHKVTRKVGFRTGPTERPVILSELRKTLAGNDEAWNDRELLDECLVFVRNRVGRPEAMAGKHDDEIFAEAIALEIRRNAPEAFPEPEKVAQTGENYVMARLEKLKKERSRSSGIGQDAYMPRI